MRPRRLVDESARILCLGTKAWITAMDAPKNRVSVAILDNGRSREIRPSGKILRSEAAAKRVGRFATRQWASAFSDSKANVLC